MKRFYCEKLYDRVWPSKPIPVYEASEADAELKRRDDEILSLKLFLKRAMQKSNLQGACDHLLCGCERSCLILDIRKKLNVPTGTKEQS